MTGEEERLVALEELKARQEALEQESAQAATPEAKNEAEAAKILMQETKQAIEKDEDGVDAALEKGAAAAVEALGAETPKVEEEPVVEPTPTESSPLGMPEPTDAEGEPDGAATPPASPPPPPSPPRGSGGAGLPPFGSGGSGGSFGSGGSGAAGGNVLPPTPNIAPTPQESDTSGRRINTGGAVLAGGLVGYLLGRRRGRIKTEKRLLPVQRKLEKEIADLHGRIAWREAAIRSLAREQNAKNPEARDEVAERLKTRHERRRDEAEKSTTNHPERLGRFALDTQRASQSEAFSTPERPKPVDRMTLPELLSIGERIKIEQSTVKRLYETNRLSDEGLRRVIRAFLRGERYERVITDNLLTPEKYPYPETLQRNSAVDSQTVGTGLTPPNLPGQPDTLLPPVNPAATSPLRPTFMPPELPAKKPTVPVGVVAVGVILAILILIFIVAR